MKRISECKWCNRQFEHKRWGARFCSGKCRSAVHNEKTFAIRNLNRAAENLTRLSKAGEDLSFVYSAINRLAAGGTDNIRLAAGGTDK